MATREMPSTTPMTFRSQTLTAMCFVSLLVPARFAAGQPAGIEPVRGPFWSGTIRGGGRNTIIAEKGIVVTVGAEKKAYVCYDTDLVRLSLAWTGGFLEFGNTLTRIEWPPPPQVKGTPVFGTRPTPGWARRGDFEDPRPHHQGPLPKDWAHYQGLYVAGDQVVLKYTVGDIQVLEAPGFENVNGQQIFTRTFQFDQATGDLALPLADGVEGTTLATAFAGATGPRLLTLYGGQP